MPKKSPSNVVDFRMIRVEYEALKKKIEKLTPSVTNLKLLETRRKRLDELSNMIITKSPQDQPEDAEKLLLEIVELKSTIDETCVSWESDLESVPSPEKSPSSSPPKPKKSKGEEFAEENKDATSVVEVVGKASAVINNLEKDYEAAKKKLSKAVKKIHAIQWPNNVRAIIFDVEGDLNLSSVVVCFQCGDVHAPHCFVDKATSKYPSEAKPQRIFLRRQRWIYAFVYLNNNPRIQRIIVALQTKFDEILLRANKQEELNEAETFILSLNDFDSLIFWFCQMVADIFEELSNTAKTIGNASEVEDLGIFAAPYNLLSTILVNSSIILKADGEVKLKSNANAMASEFMPKRK